VGAEAAAAMELPVASAPTLRDRIS
jgi:hypothetical protein